MGLLSGLFALLGVVMFLFWLLPYFLLNILVPAVRGKQDLKMKYGAQWAIVTGASSGVLVCFVD